MTVGLTKSTFTAEEAAELERMGYTMAEVTHCGEYTSEWVIAIAPNSKPIEIIELSHPAIDTITSVKNKEPSW